MLVSRSELTRRWKHSDREQGRWTRAGEREKAAEVWETEKAVLPTAPLITAVWLSTGNPAIPVGVPTCQTTDSTPRASGHVTRPGSWKSCSLPWPQ